MEFSRDLEEEQFTQMFSIKQSSCCLSFSNKKEINEKIIIKIFLVRFLFLVWNADEKVLLLGTCAFDWQVYGGEGELIFSNFHLKNYNGLGIEFLNTLLVKFQKMKNCRKSKKI
jgi:hypothetical protein